MTHHKLLADAIAGNAYAQFTLGCMYANGRGVPQDDTEAVAWIRKAAEQGDADAQFNLGVMYEDGQGVPKDDTQAVVWFRKAAEQGDAGAQTNLGVMYANGRGVPQDDTQAVAWYRKAAEQGDESAQFNLGWMYENGRGVPQDDTQAVVWYQKAVKQGLADTQHNSEICGARSIDVGVMHENGRDVMKYDENVLYADGFDDALIGIGTQFTTSLAVYDWDMCVQILQTRDGMTYEDAVAWMDYNVTGAYVGTHTPVFVRRYPQESEPDTMMTDELTTGDIA